MRETFGSGSFVIDIRSETLPVSKWTRILGTEQQFTHLLNLFWTWDNTLSRIVDREAFVHDLKAGANDPSTMDSIENCSPFLVNALLAVGSVWHTNHPMSSSSILTAATPRCTPGSLRN